MSNFWLDESVPEEWRKGTIVKLLIKGDTSDCNNWRGITLLSVPGKIFCTIMVIRLRDAVDTVLRNKQAGFRRRRSCREQIFTLRNIIEQCLEFRKPLFLNFIVFTKHFDSVHRESLWHIARLYCIPQQYINIFKRLYLNSSYCVKTDLGLTEFFHIVTSVRQGCVLSPFLFLLMVDFVRRKATIGPSLGIK